MSEWIKVAKLEDCPPGSVQEIIVEDRVIALLNVDGDLFAMDGLCAHQGGPLGKGSLRQGVITCPWHGWQYDARTGCQLTSGRIAQPCYKVRVDADRVWVNSDAIDLSACRE